jgi:hypothetical protein
MQIVPDRGDRDCSEMRGDVAVQVQDDEFLIRWRVDMQTLSIEVSMLWMLLPPLQTSKDILKCENWHRKASWV